MAPSLGFRQAPERNPRPMGLSAEELAALDKLTDAINAIHALPTCHAADYVEMLPHFHAIQDKVMARAAVRAHPDIFGAEADFA